MSGTLVLVVGPSGAGKDTILAAARERLASDKHFLFARRFITRPESSGGEDHLAVTPEAFERLEAQGAFALCWRAHDLAYGIPATIGAHLTADGVAVANGSRAIIPQARRLFPLAVILVTASAEILAARLEARAREPASDIATRLLRSGEPVEGADVHIIRNETSVDEAAEQMVAILRSFVRR